MSGGVAAVEVDELHGSYSSPLSQAPASFHCSTSAPSQQKEAEAHVHWQTKSRCLSEFTHCPPESTSSSAAFTSSPRSPPVRSHQPGGEQSAASLFFSSFLSDDDNFDEQDMQASSSANTPAGPHEGSRPSTKVKVKKDDPVVRSRGLHRKPMYRPALQALYKEKYSFLASVPYRTQGTAASGGSEEHMIPLRFGTVLLDPATDDCSILSASRGFCEMSGFSPYEILDAQHGFLELMEAEDKTDVDAQLAFYDYVDRVRDSVPSFPDTNSSGAPPEPSDSSDPYARAFSASASASAAGVFISTEAEGLALKLRHKKRGGELFDHLIHVTPLYIPVLVRKRTRRPSGSSSWHQSRERDGYGGSTWTASSEASPSGTTQPPCGATAGASPNNAVPPGGVEFVTDHQAMATEGEKEKGDSSSSSSSSSVERCGREGGDESSTVAASSACSFSLLTNSRGVSSDTGIGESKGSYGGEKGSAVSSSSSASAGGSIPPTTLQMPRASLDARLAWEQLEWGAPKESEAPLVFRASASSASSSSSVDSSSARPGGGTGTGLRKPSSSSVGVGGGDRGEVEDRWITGVRCFLVALCADVTSMRVTLGEELQKAVETLIISGEPQSQLCVPFTVSSGGEAQKAKLSRGGSKDQLQQQGSRQDAGGSAGSEAGEDGGDSREDPPATPCTEDDCGGDPMFGQLGSSAASQQVSARPLLPQPPVASSADRPSAGTVGSSSSSSSSSSVAPTVRAVAASTSGVTASDRSPVNQNLSTAWHYQHQQMQQQQQQQQMQQGDPIATQQQVEWMPLDSLTVPNQPPPQSQPPKAPQGMAVAPVEIQGGTHPHPHQANQVPNHSLCRNGNEAGLPVSSAGGVGGREASPGSIRYFSNAPLGCAPVLDNCQTDSSSAGSAYGVYSSPPLAAPPPQLPPDLQPPVAPSSSSSVSPSPSLYPNNQQTNPTFQTAGALSPLLLQAQLRQLQVPCVTRDASGNRGVQLISLGSLNPDQQRDVLSALLLATPNSPNPAATSAGDVHPPPQTVPLVQQQTHTNAPFAASSFSGAQPAGNGGPAGGYFCGSVPGPCGAPSWVPQGGGPGGQPPGLLGGSGLLPSSFPPHAPTAAPSSSTAPPPPPPTTAYAGVGGLRGPMGGGNDGGAPLIEFPPASAAVAAAAGGGGGRGEVPLAHPPPPPPPLHHQSGIPPPS
uniref:PAS domain-containing protein n=1 Tax=Chromera velia CCMP2878 TaxID=1169474 RepID=A0A0G4I6Q9_9ALVE|eukprot:Cvel_1898.t1-p1 / transcript=Cvel_1898.t1 / gene=Cvel_1898 / organism=Chromera_velia_CCMP2878 / gene_product=hypothetical protein / transcript_product=hypothetical protein / location=Cvel_scaffold71:30255-35708(+) / protein_length=1187 / sequence_SO=supercontig / SO=protein_coding / is_pseudo=false